MRVCGPLSECNRVCVALFGSVSQAWTMCAWRGLLSRRTRCRVKSNMRSRGHVGVVFASHGARVALSLCLLATATFVPPCGLPMLLSRHAHDLMLPTSSGRGTVWLHELPR